MKPASNIILNLLPGSAYDVVPARDDQLSSKLSHLTYGPIYCVGQQLQP